MIPLTKGKKAKIDDEDFGKVSFYKWCLNSSGYAVTNLPSRKQLLMHRLIVDAPEGSEVDHKNFDRTDNRRSNLTVVTRHQNNLNRRMYTNNKSGYRGVTKRGNKWRAAITVNGKHVHLGQFNTLEEASVAYEAERLKVWDKELA